MSISDTPDSQSKSQARQRRAHHKSRNGCKACKARRTKCDEQGPPCINCTIRQTDCVYAAKASLRQAPSSTETRSIFDDLSSDVTVTSKPQNRNLLELKLLFHWTTHTSDTIGRDSIDGGHWKIQGTEEALKFEPLLDALMATTAAHIADTKTPSHPDYGLYANAALEYYGRCCNAFKTEVVNIVSKNCGAVLYCSMLLVTVRFTMPRYGGEEEPCINRIIGIFELLQGTWSIAQIIYKEQHGELNTEMLLERYESKPLDASILEALERLRQVNRHSIPSGTTGPRSKDYTACNKAIDLLEHWWARTHLKTEGPVFIWLLSVPRDFVSLVSIGDPTAQLILLHYSVMFEEICGDGRWWSHSIGKRLVAELSSSLASTAIDDIQKMAIKWAQEAVQT